MNLVVVRRMIVGIAVLVVMVLFTACAGVGTSGQTTLSGSIVSVNPANHSVTLNIGGQTKTINGLTDQEIAFLQTQVGVGKVYSITVTQNSDGTYSIVAGTNVTPETSEGTPQTGETSTPETTGTSEPGNVQFIGNVTSSGNGSITVSMPGGSSLLMSVVSGQTDLGDFNALPGVNTRVKAEATWNNGSFTATKLDMVKSDDDANQVKFQGVTTQAVGSDKVIHFAVGNKSFSFTIASNADLGDFNGNTQSIGNGVTVKVTVEYNGSTATVTKVSQ